MSVSAMLWIRAKEQSEVVKLENAQNAQAAKYERTGHGSFPRVGSKAGTYT